MTDILSQKNRILSSRTSHDNFDFSSHLVLLQDFLHIPLFVNPSAISKD